MAATQAMTGQQYGDWLESEVQAGLDELMTAGPTFFTRLYDTRSACSFLPKQAGDFIGTCHGRGFLLEVKGSIKYQSLSDSGALRGLVKSHQALGGYLMSRAGGLGLLVFRSRLSGRTELWDLQAVRDVYVTPRAKLRQSVRDGLLDWADEHPDAKAKAVFKDLFESKFR